MKWRQTIDPIHDHILNVASLPTIATERHLDTIFYMLELGSLGDIPFSNSVSLLAYNLNNCPVPQTWNNAKKIHKFRGKRTSLLWVKSKVQIMLIVPVWSEWMSSRFRQAFLPLTVKIFASTIKLGNTYYYIMSCKDYQRSIQPKARVQEGYLSRKSSSIFKSVWILPSLASPNPKAILRSLKDKISWEIS